MDRTTAEKAAKYWADCLRNPQPMDNGDKSPTGAMTFMLAAMLQSKVAPKNTPEKIDAFEKELADAIESQESDYFWLDVDYSPCGILNDAAEKAGVVIDGVLPWKTGVSFRDGKVYVTQGYGAKEREL